MNNILRILLIAGIGVSGISQVDALPTSQAGRFAVGLCGGVLGATACLLSVPWKNNPWRNLLNKQIKVWEKSKADKKYWKLYKNPSEYTLGNLTLEKPRNTSFFNIKNDQKKVGEALLNKDPKIWIFGISDRNIYRAHVKKMIQNYYLHKRIEKDINPLNITFDR
jgi:hypothetical protein